MLQATSRRNQCPAYPARSSLSRSVCGMHHVRPHGSIHASVMPFPKKIRETVLVRSHRRCCVCHKFAGRNVNVHHIVQEADGGENTIDNAICLCLPCHADAGHFNSRHPLGTKYSPDELRAHRDQWWIYCESHPEMATTHLQEEIVRLRQFLTCHANFFRYLFHQGSELAFRIDIQYLERIEILTTNWDTDTMRSYDSHIRRLQDQIISNISGIYNVIYENENVYKFPDCKHVTFDGSSAPNSVLMQKRKQIGAHVEAIGTCYNELSEIAAGNTHVA